MENIKYEVIVSTGEIIERPMTPEELAQDEIDRNEAAERLAAKEAVQAEIEAKRQALLNKLGITAEEAALLLG